jgi:hypothetical protein
LALHGGLQPDRAMAQEIPQLPPPRVGCAICESPTIRLISLGATISGTATERLDITNYGALESDRNNDGPMLVRALVPHEQERFDKLNANGKRHNAIVVVTAPRQVRTLAAECDGASLTHKQSPP